MFSRSRADRIHRGIDHERQSTGITPLRAVGSLVALSLVIATTMIATRRQPINKPDEQRSAMLEEFAVFIAGCMVTVVAFISIWVAMGCGRSFRRFPGRGVLRGRA